MARSSTKKQGNKREREAKASGRRRSGETRSAKRTSRRSRAGSDEPTRREKPRRTSSDRPETGRTDPRKARRSTGKLKAGARSSGKPETRRSTGKLKASGRSSGKPETRRSTGKLKASGRSSGKPEARRSTGKLKAGGRSTSKLKASGRSTGRLETKRKSGKHAASSRASGRAKGSSARLAARRSTSRQPAVGGRRSGESARGRPSPQPGRSKTPLVAGGAGVLLLLGGALFFAFAGDPTPRASTAAAIQEAAPAELQGTVVVIETPDAEPASEPESPSAGLETVASSMTSMTRTRAQSNEPEPGSFEARVAERVAGLVTDEVARLHMDGEDVDDARRAALAESFRPRVLKALEFRASLLAVAQELAEGDTREGIIHAYQHALAETVDELEPRILEGDEEVGTDASLYRMQLKTLADERLGAGELDKALKALSLD